MSGKGLIGTEAFRLASVIDEAIDRIGLLTLVSHKPSRALLDELEEIGAVMVVRALQAQWQLEESYDTRLAKEAGGRSADAGDGVGAGMAATGSRRSMKELQRALRSAARATCRQLKKYPAAISCVEAAAEEAAEERVARAAARRRRRVAAEKARKERGESKLEDVAEEGSRGGIGGIGGISSAGGGRVRGSVDAGATSGGDSGGSGDGDVDRKTEEADDGVPAALAAELRSAGARRLLHQLRELRALLFTKLTSTEDDSTASKKAHYGEATFRMKEAEERHVALMESVADVRLHREQDVSDLDTVLVKLRAELTQIQDTTDAEVSALEEEMAEEMERAEEDHLERMESLRKQLADKEDELNAMTLDHRGVEEALRKRKGKTDTDVRTHISRYDELMSERTREMEDINSHYAVEKEKLAKLEEHFRRIDDDARAAAEEEARFAEEQERARIARRDCRAATLLQATWRGYAVRRIDLKERARRKNARRRRK
eukprot:PLAT15366.1.p1 GENE.PLAT15366.1~~PLAT15366.1.p1  ORF type:complete len:490 (+),score=294.61 PLAT15366.1:39-1508(+)